MLICPINNLSHFLPNDTKRSANFTANTKDYELNRIHFNSYLLYALRRIAVD